MSTVTNTTWNTIVDIVEDETVVSVEQGTLHMYNDTLKVHTSNGIKKVSSSKVTSVVSSATVTPTSNDTFIKITAQSAGLTLANPIGTFEEGQDFMFRIKDNGTSRAITFDTKYRAIGVTLPTATTISKTTYIGVIYNETDDKFDVLGVSTQA